MRGPFDAMFRWWKEGSDHTNGASRISGPEPSPSPGESESRVSIEPPWLAQLDREGIPRALRYPSTTLGRIVDQTADRFGDHPALIYNHTRWSYRELLARINRLAGGLSQLGVGAGDRVVLALPNCPEYVLSFFAVQKLGAVLVNAGPLMGTDDLRSLISLTSPRLVIGLDLLASKIIAATTDSSVVHLVWVTLQSYQTLLRRIGYQIKLWHGSHRSNGSTKPIAHTTLAELLKNASARPPTVAPHADALAVLQPTSGTTGALKLVQLSHRNLLCNAMQMTVWMNARHGQETVLTVLPMFHVYGLMTGLINPVCCASTIILTTRFDPERTLDILIEERPTVFPLVPAICDALSNEIERRDPRPQLRGLRVCISGAAPLPQSIAERFERLTGARVIEGYGLSETSPVTHANLLSHPRYGTIGLPMPDTFCRVADLDDDTRDAPVGQPGELLICGPQVMSGYFGNPDATRDALWTDEQGRPWFRTGDVVRVDEDGFFQIIDRKKDMIIHSGLKVYPAKVEKVLITHPQVTDVAVIGQPETVHTEIVVAFIVPTSPETNHEALVDELRGLSREHLAPYEVPARFEFIEQIPRSVLGKVLKTRLREELKQRGSPPRESDEHQKAPMQNANHDAGIELPKPA